MALPVIVKSTKKGLHLVLDLEMDFEELLEKIGEKFTQSKDFFRDAEFAISFSGRDLSTEEECRIINTVSECCGARIACILDENELLDEYIEERIQQIADEKTMKSGQFFKGDIQSGETYESDRSVIVIGSVLPGGKVISKGNIVVLGRLEGYAFAGAGGNEAAFICALHMSTDQLRIADAVLKNTKGTRGGIRKRKNKVPQIAVAKDNTVMIEPVTKGYLNSI